MRNPSKTQYTTLDYLFFLPPIFALIMYIVDGDELSNKVFMFSNVIGTALLIKQTHSKTNRIFMIAVSLFFISYLFYGKEVEGARLYLSATLYTYVLLLYFGENNYVIKNEKHLRKIDKLIGVFAIILICGQLMTIDNPLQFLRLNYDSVDEDALEKKGFLISHAFGYYLASLTMYYAYRKKLTYMIGLSLLCFFFSRRTVVLMCALGWFYYFKERYGNRKAIIFATIMGVVCISYIGATAYFGDFSFSFDPTDSESASFTSGRSRFWGSFIYYKLLSGNMSFSELFLGAGPASSREFNLEYCGIKVWMHNDFFDLLFCLGIVGLSLYVFAIIMACKRLGLYFGIFLLLSANLNGFMLYQTFPIVYLFSIIKTLDGTKYGKKSGTKYLGHPSCI